jgi:hypothetical protein
MAEREVGVPESEALLPIATPDSRKPKGDLAPPQVTRKGGSDSQAGLWLSRTKTQEQSTPKSHSLVRDSPVNSGVDGAILSRKKKPLRSG